ncbi:hypothetical protein R0135_07685 [Congregibacter variabilis]|uniref:WalW protein n=1 Tax=Congregibacter variabilis TaxID=3081200 RepID=A0ABZ0IAD4_9GAMM|nr:hypothetical protein R0135_07685 [Congregibacter sp. IMCC43200]
MSARPNLLFVLSIDTEEEFDWDGPFPQGDFGVNNAAKLADFQSFCGAEGIRPSYFIDHAMAASPATAQALRGAVDTGACEIAAHLHPWANPPFYGETSEFESHVVNLPIERTEAKLDELLHCLYSSFGVYPNAFRTGRWGINGEILRLLHRKGFRIDSSMYPFYKNPYFNCESTPLAPYWPNFDQPMAHGSQRDLLEFPVTVGYNHANYPIMHGIYKIASAPKLERLRLVGALWQLRLIRKLYLSPEVSTGQEMCPLVDFAIANNLPTLHMFLHSSSLISSGNGLMPAGDPMQEIMENIRTLLEYAQSRAELQFCTISEAATLISHRQQLAA